MNTSFSIKDKVKFLQIKQDTIDKSAAKNMKRDSISAYIHMRRDTPSPYTQLNAFWMTPPPPPRPPVQHQLHTHLIDDPFLNQKTYKYIRISYLLKHEHSKK